jgi:LmbE family N-acetylglucosaminyl deacetylase/SAM-dependent methyltransferase
VVTFDARQPGTPAADWDASGIRDAPPLDLTGVTSLVVVAAHPDDETLGAGGFMSAVAEAGLPVRVVVVTDGGADGDPATPARRSAELRAALDELAAGIPVDELGFPDGQVLENRDAVAAALDLALADEPASTLLVAPWAGDGHRDHRVVGELVLEHAGGRRVADYPIWAWHWDDPADPALPRDTLRSHPVDVERKRRAIERFASQVEGDEPMLRADVVEHFLRDREVFVITDRAALTPAYFEKVYSRRDDPWRYRERWYEARKRDATLAALPRRRYPRTLEVGCSIGMLTERLADRSVDLLAIDVAERAVAQTRERLRDRDGARVELRDASVDFPPGPFDLVVLSEVGYYFGDALDHVLAAARDALAPGGELLACHWRHPVADYPLSGDEVHARIARLGLRRLVAHEEEDFVLEVWSSDDRSVARREGLS